MRKFEWMLRLRRIGSLDRSGRFFALLVLASMGAPLFVPSFGHSAEYQCREECETFEADRLASYRECIERAEKIADRSASLRQRQYCRSRYPNVSCEAFPPCREERGTKDRPVFTEFEVANLGLAVLSPRSNQNVSEDKRVYAGQTVWIRYEVRVPSSAEGNLRLQQQLTIQNAKGEVVHSDETVFEKPAGLSTVYSLRSSFSVPENFPAGEYAIVLQIREGIRSWRGEKRLLFTVVSGKS